MNFIVKKMVGDQISNLTGGDEPKDDGGGSTEVDPEVLEERQRIEEERRLRHERQEMEREKMRQEVRDKYKIKKKEDMMAPPVPAAGRVGRGQFSPMAVKEDEDVELSWDNLTPDNVQKKATFLFKSAKDSVFGLFGDD